METYEDAKGNIKCPRCNIIWTFAIWTRFSKTIWLECLQCYHIFEVPISILVAREVFKCAQDAKDC